MADVYDTETRKRVMRAVHSENTKPEKLVRSLLHRLGFRFRLHCKKLPGAPDIVLPSRRIAIFVHGCFWHGHDCTRGGRIPKSNTEYWIDKREKNRLRDRRVITELTDCGWRSVVVWECETNDLEGLSVVLLKALTDNPI